MYYFLFVCVAFFLRSYIIRDVYMKTASFSFSALAAHSSIAAVLPQPEISTSPCYGAALLIASTLAQGHADDGDLSPGEAAPASPAPERDAPAHPLLSALFKPRCKSAGMLSAFRFLLCMVVVCTFSAERGQRRILEPGRNPLKVSQSGSGCRALGSRRSSFEKQS